jgi:hypothetical protein
VTFFGGRYHPPILAGDQFTHLVRGQRLGMSPTGCGGKIVGTFPLRRARLLMIM